MDIARIVIERHSRWVDRARSYQVLVDGQERDRVRNGASATINVWPGRHVVQLKIDWASSPHAVVELRPGEEARLRCRPRANVLTVMYYTTFGRKRYLRLEAA